MNELYWYCISTATAKHYISHTHTHPGPHFVSGLHCDHVTKVLCPSHLSQVWRPEFRADRNSVNILANLWVREKAFEFDFLLGYI